MKKNLCLMPSADTQMHEWKKHGACGPGQRQGLLGFGRRPAQGAQDSDLYQLAKDGRMVSAAVVHEFVKGNPMLKGHEDAIQVQTMPAPAKPARSG
jgi:ribonuclease T2